MSTEKSGAAEAKEPESELDPTDTLVEETEFTSADDDDAKPETSNVGQTSVEIDVDELIAEFEAESGRPLQSGEGSARKRLEEVLEARRIADELEDLDDFESTLGE